MKSTLKRIWKSLDRWCRYIQSACTMSLGFIHLFWIFHFIIIIIIFFVVSLSERSEALKPGIKSRLLNISVTSEVITKVRESLRENRINPSLKNTFNYLRRKIWSSNRAGSFRAREIESLRRRLFFRSCSLAGDAPRSSGGLL